MCTSRHLNVGLSILWLVIAVLLSAVGFTGTAETLSQTPAKALVSPSVNLLVPPPMNLQFQTMDLQFRVEDVKGAVQALAMKETKTEVKIELSGDVLFEFDKADIRPDAEPALSESSRSSSSTPGRPYRSTATLMPRGQIPIISDFQTGERPR
jgi:hypothetical protein